MGIQVVFSQHPNVNRSNRASNNHSPGIENNELLYQTQLQTWCDALIKIQIKTGSDEGGIYCEAHRLVNGRCGDAVYPFLTLYKITGLEKYRTAASTHYRKIPGKRMVRVF